MSNIPSNKSNRWEDRLRDRTDRNDPTHAGKAKAGPSSLNNSKFSLESAGSSSDLSGIFDIAKTHLTLPPVPPNRVGAIDSPSMHPEAEEAQEGQMDTYGFPPVATQAEMTIEDLRSFFRSRSFLIVDDNPLNLMVLAQLFKKAGITNFTKAESGAQAISLAKTHVFDVILMDYNMPQMNGDVAIKCIRGIPGYEKLPIILGYTANSDEEVKSNFLAAGANGSVIKPLLEPVLLRTIYDLYLSVNGDQSSKQVRG